MTLNVDSTSCAMHAAWTRFWAPPERLSVSDWAERHVRLPDDNNAEPGPLKLRKWQRDMVDRVMQPQIRTGVFMLASQIGKSLSIDCLLAHAICVEPGPMLHVSPDDGAVKAFVRERFDPLMHSTTALRERIGKGKRRGDALNFKRFPGGFLSFASSFKAPALAARSIRYAWLDEVDRFCPTLRREGDPVELARKRLHAFRRISKTIISSSPTVEGSRIAQWFERGDRCEFACACPECGELQALVTENLSWPKGAPQSAVLRCVGCGHGISDRERLDMLETGDWVATNDTPEMGIASFHASILVGHLTLHAEVAADMEAAELDDEKRRVFRNTSDALPHRENAAERLDPEALKARAETIRAPYDSALLYVVAAVDIQQKGRAEVMFLGCAKAGVQAVLDHIVRPGDVSSESFWRALSTDLGRTFPTVDGRVLPVAMTAIDTGFEIDRVAAFVIAERALGRLIRPIKGVSDRISKIPEARPVIVETEKIRGTRLSMWSIGVDTTKTQLARRLNMPEPGPGYIHLPNHLDEEFWLSLTAEKRETVVTKSGHVTHRWVKIRPRNEVWDCLVYAAAIATKVKAPASTPVKTARPAPSISEFAESFKSSINKGANNGHA